MQTMQDTKTTALESHRAVPRRRSDDRLGVGVGVLAGVAWLVFAGAALAVQPAPDPNAAPTALGEIVSLAFTLAMVGAAVGLGTRRRWGLWATTGGGATLMAAAGLCFLAGHTEAWLAIQMAAGLGLFSTAWVLNRIV